MHKKSGKGFTLIELMVTVAIIAILAGIAYPSYQGYITRSRRADGFSALQQFAAAMERYYTTNGSYLGAAAGGGNTGAPAVPGTFQKATAPLDSSAVYYNLTIQAATASTFTLRATPVNSQAGDGIAEITHTGRRGWDQNNDGDTADAGEADWDK